MWPRAETADLLGDVERIGDIVKKADFFFLHGCVDILIYKAIAKNVGTRRQGA